MRGIAHLNAPNEGNIRTYIAIFYSTRLFLVNNAYICMEHNVETSVIEAK